MKKVIMLMVLVMITGIKANAINEVEKINALMENGVEKNEKSAMEIFGIEDVTKFDANQGMTVGADDKDVNMEALGTYKNWLGEECIDFGKEKKSYYNWVRDVTYAGIPLFLSSFIIKDKKRAFRSARFSMNENWKSEIDNYTQISPYAVIVGLKALGYEGRSSWDRLMTSALFSNAVMALIVNSTKYSVKEMRPDNSSANSFPSGHTATAFTAATILHKEYGLTRSPWFSVAGYTVAMGTGFMRVLNNRHWISDVIAGAGIGIMSTELGYFLADIIYKNRGITRLELNGLTDANHPSFFDIQLGVGMHKKNMSARYDDGDTDDFQFGTSTVVGVEGAYFFNKYFGVGGMARVTTTPVKGLGLTEDDIKQITDLNMSLHEKGMPCLYNVKSSNSNFIDGSFDAGIYGNLPLSSHFSLGAKALIGVRVNGGYEYKAEVGFKKTATDNMGADIYTGTAGIDGSPTHWSPVYLFENADGSTFPANETLMPGVEKDYNFFLDPQRFKSGEYTLVNLTGGSSLNYVLGISATYRYKDNFSWKIFIDYDSARNNYNYNMHLFNDIAMDYFMYNAPEIYEKLKGKTDYHTSFKSRFDLFTIGAAFSVNF